MFAGGQAAPRSLPSPSIPAHAKSPRPPISPLAFPRNSRHHISAEPEPAAALRPSPALSSVPRPAVAQTRRVPRPAPPRGDTESSTPAIPTLRKSNSAASAVRARIAAPAFAVPAAALCIADALQPRRCTQHPPHRLLAKNRRCMRSPQRIEHRHRNPRNLRGPPRMRVRRARGYPQPGHRRHRQPLPLRQTVGPLVPQAGSPQHQLAVAVDPCATLAANRLLPRSSANPARHRTPSSSPSSASTSRSCTSPSRSCSRFRLSLHSAYCSGSRFSTV